MTAKKGPDKSGDKNEKRPGGSRPQQDKVPHPHDGNQLAHGGRQKSGEADMIAEDENQGEGMPAVGGQR